MLLFFYYFALLCSFLFLFLWSWEIFQRFSLKHAIVIYIQVSSFEKTFINALPRLIPHQFFGPDLHSA